MKTGFAGKLESYQKAFIAADRKFRMNQIAARYCNLDNIEELRRSARRCYAQLRRMKRALIRMTSAINERWEYHFEDRDYGFHPAERAICLATRDALFDVYAARRAACRYWLKMAEKLAAREPQVA